MKDNRAKIIKKYKTFIKKVESFLEFANFYCIKA